MRSLITFSASCERAGGSAWAVSALLISTCTEILGSPLLRMNWMRSFSLIWLSDFCTSLILIDARTVVAISPSLPSCGASSE
ncbi:MAG: hypothetical protein H7Y16_10370 [Candidatus Parcubacteria bacterium]|nr:hypothetical protein [Burkholderiales bacterium]